MINPKKLHKSIKVKKEAHYNTMVLKHGRGYVANLYIAGKCSCDAVAEIRIILCCSWNLKPCITLRLHCISIDFS
jgi:hypothetical protein